MHGRTRRVTIGRADVFAPEVARKRALALVGDVAESMNSVKLLLGVDTARMSPTDLRRIKAVMAGLGWDYGTHRLHDLGRRVKAQRKGFAGGSVEERTVEHNARRIDGGIVVIDRLDGRHGEQPPF